VSIKKFLDSNFRSIAVVLSILTGFVPFGARADEPVRVASILDLSGPVATLGQYAKRGADIALKEINDAGGINGRPLEFVSFNSESKPDLATSLGIRVISQPDILAMIGGNFGSTQYALSALAEKHKIPLSTPTGLVTEEQRTWKYTFFTLVESSDTARAMLDYAKTKGYKKLAIMRLEREYGELGAKFLRKFAPGYGVEVVAEERGADSDRDFTAQLSKIRDANADFIVVWFANPGGSLLLKNAKQIGIAVPMIAPPSMDSAATVKLAGDAAEGLILAAQIAGGEPLPRQQTFAKGYSAAFPTTPEANSFEAAGYDAVKIVALALKRIEPPYTREKLRDSLSTLNYDGAGSILHYSATKNDPTADAIILTQIKNGKFVLVR
jgi:branched-chain amino acid transport system substrate-binding protein